MGWRLGRRTLSGPLSSSFLSPILHWKANLVMTLSLEKIPLHKIVSIISFVLPQGFLHHSSFHFKRDTVKIEITRALFSFSIFAV